MRCGNMLPFLPLASGDKYIGLGQAKSAWLLPKKCSVKAA